MRLIDADALKENLKLPEESGRMGELLEMVIHGAIDDAPTIEERKKGEWIHVTGYCTPGGDPVWACSECGKGEHVYGIEYQTYSHNVSDGQWVSCPNCGARMEVEHDA